MTKRPVVIAVANDVDDAQLVAALTESEVRGGAPLRMVHVRNPILVADGPLVVSAPYAYVDVTEAGRDHLARCVDMLRTAAVRHGLPMPEVEEILEEGDVSAALLRRSRDAAVIVLGVDSTLGSMLVGRTALRLSREATAPVVVARGHLRPGPVVIGVPRNGLARPALIEAFAAADYRRCAVRAVRAVGLPDWLIDVDEATIPTERTQVAEILAGHSSDWPDVHVEIVVERGAAKEALLRHSEEASLLVVGSAAKGPLRAAALGSVAIGMLHHSLCPVMVVPADRNAGE